MAQRDVRALFRDELLNNLKMLKEIRDDRNELASPRIMSIREINDRALGRPVQPNESANEFLTSANPVERLEREVEQLSAQRLTRELPPPKASEQSAKSTEGHRTKQCRPTLTRVPSPAAARLTCAMRRTAAQPLQGTAATVNPMGKIVARHNPKASCHRVAGENHIQIPPLARSGVSCQLHAE